MGDPSEWNKAMERRSEQARARAEGSFGRGFARGFGDSIDPPRQSAPAGGGAFGEGLAQAMVWLVEKTAQVLWYGLRVLFRLACAVPALLGALPLLLLPRVVPRLRNFQLSFATIWPVTMRAAASYFMGQLVIAVCFALFVNPGSIRAALRAELGWLPKAVLSASPFLLMQFVGFLVCAVTLPAAFRKACGRGKLGPAGTLLALCAALTVAGVPGAAVFVVVMRGIA